MKLALLAALLCSSPLYAQVEIFAKVAGDRYQLTSYTEDEVDKTGLGYSGFLGGSLTLWHGNIFLGLGARRVKAEGTTDDIKQELIVQDIATQFGYLFHVPGIEEYLWFGGAVQSQTGQGSILAYTEEAKRQTAYWGGPLLQIRIPVNDQVSPYIDAAYFWDINNAFYEGRQLSVGLGIAMSFGASKSTSEAPPPAATPTPEAAATPAPAASPAPEASVPQEATLTVGQEMITFPLGEVRLQQSPEDFIANLAKALNASPGEWSRIDVIGYAEDTELQLAGSDLAKRRAEYVKQLLVKYGVAEEKIKTVTPPAGTVDLTSKQRVELVIIGKSTGTLQTVIGPPVDAWYKSTIRIRVEPLTLEKGKTKVSEGGRLYLKALANVLMQHPTGWKMVIVTGFTDASGSAKANQRIANARGQEQAKLLISYGVPKDRVKGLGVSTKVLLNKEDPVSKWNRRAEIEIQGITEFEALKQKITAIEGK